MGRKSSTYTSIYFVWTNTVSWPSGFRLQWCLWSTGLCPNILLAPVKWSDASPPLSLSLSLPLSTHCHTFWVASGLMPQLKVCLLDSCHAWFSPLTFSDHPSDSRWSRAACEMSLHSWASCESGWCQNKANVSSSVVYIEMKREWWNWVIIVTFIFCPCDKCIIAPYYRYTKTLFVLFKSQFLKLLFSDITKSFPLVMSQLSSQLDIGPTWKPYCLEFLKSFLICICETFFIYCI